MSNVFKIKDILLKEFNCVYCWNCAYDVSNDDEGCEYCHRKNIGWTLSPITAEDIANRILQALEVKDE